MKNGYIATGLFILLPLLGVLLLLGVYALAYQLLTPEHMWLFRTDACPESSMSCGQMAPFMFILLVLIVALAVVGDGLWRVARRVRRDSAE